MRRIEVLTRNVVKIAPSKIVNGCDFRLLCQLYSVFKFKNHNGDDINLRVKVIENNFCPFRRPSGK